MFRTIITLATMISAVAVSLPAAAQDIDQMHVRFSDLNLTSSIGAEVFHRRVNGAIERLCGRTEPRDIATTMAVQKCRKDAWTSVRPQVETQLASSRDGSPLFTLARR